MGHSSREGTGRIGDPVGKQKGRGGRSGGLKPPRDPWGSKAGEIWVKPAGSWAADSRSGAKWGQALAGCGSDLPRAEAEGLDGCGRRPKRRRAHRPFCPVFGPAVGACALSRSCYLHPQFPLASSPVLAPGPWDFPSLQPGAVTHKTQGICSESPFSRPGLGTQSLWGQGSPGQPNVLLCSPSSLHSLPLPH